MAQRQAGRPGEACLLHLTVLNHTVQVGLAGRLWLLSACTATAAPLAVLTLTTAPPPAMAALLGYYLMAETWFAVLFTVIVEIVRDHL